MSTIEERMSSSIVYNLRILTMVIKPNDHLDDYLTDGLFMKTNTQAFIQVTYYLFSILDLKEFKKKFYWPIVDKKSENSYRTNSVEFINSLIDKYSIKQEKIKHVSVVHPSGKKFMSLILDLIMITIKEVMKRKNYSTDVSLDLEKAEEVVNTMHEIETELASSIKSELKTIREKTNEIQELINSIYPNDSPVPFEEFITNWNLINRKRLNIIKEQKAKVKEIFEKANILQQKGHEMLKNKEYKIVKPSDVEIKELADFYQHIELPIDNELNIVSLILHLKSSLSVVQNYIENFSYDEVEISDEEMRIVKRKLEELKQFEPLIQKLNEKEKKLKEKITKIKKERKEDEDDVQNDELVDEAQGKEIMRSLTSPRHYFDASKNSMSRVHKRHKLAFGESDGTFNVDHSMHPLNQSRLYRPLSDTCLNRSKEMGPPKPKEVPSRRRKRDPMAILDKALASSKSKPDMNSTAVNTGAIPKLVASTPFSSTMLSPDLIHHANFSMISNISSVTQTSYVPNKLNNINTQSKNVFAPPKPDVLSNDSMNQILWNDKISVKKESLEEEFRCKMVLFETDQNISNPSTVPKIVLNEETLCGTSSMNEFTLSSENTICEKENFGSELDTVMFTKKQACEEDLFNVSDSVLIDD
ncbi:kinesin-related protein 4 [Chironomus tepperi]|uniref:kinesin-related protein 4 n=1 Tax=Chironomus tepperi TaxID=113505 RepID=UPI00391F246D